MKQMLVLDGNKPLLFLTTCFDYREELTKNIQSGRGKRISTRKRTSRRKTAWIQKKARVSSQVLSQHLTNRIDRLTGNIMDSIHSLKWKSGWIQWEAKGREKEKKKKKKRKKKKKKNFREAQQVQSREKQNGGNLQCVSAHCGASSLYQLDNDGVNKPLIGAPAAVRMESKC